MKIVKKIAGTILFFGIGIMLFLSISYILRPVENNFERKKITGFYAEEEDSLDIVGIGGSGLYFYFNNLLLWEEKKWTSYNFSTANQSNFMMGEILDEIKKTQSPQLYIIEVRKFLLSEDKNENEKQFPLVINNMKYSWNRVELINNTFDSWEERMLYYFDILMYHENWEKFTLKNLQYMDNKEYNMTKGWANRKESNPIKLRKIVPETKLQEVPVSEASEEELRNVLNKCKEENIPVLFLATPFSIRKKNQEKMAYVKRIIEGKGFLFLDCNQYQEEIGLDAEVDFVNKGHVNMLGAEKVTRFIGNYIQENFQISQTADEEIAEKWNEAAGQNAADAEKKRAAMLGK